jgi:putative endonuclease
MYRDTDQGSGATSNSGHSEFNRDIKSESRGSINRQFLAKVCLLEEKCRAHNPAAAGSQDPVPATKPKSVAWVYIVQNPEGQFYTGITTDLERRIQDHNSGISQWTKHRGPWQLVWNQECPTISEARKLENKLKRQARGDGFFKLTGLQRPSGS